MEQPEPCRPACYRHDPAVALEELCAACREVVLVLWTELAAVGEYGPH